MRVTEGMTTTKLLYSEKKISEKKDKIAVQLANNSKIETVSDDVAGALDSINLNSQIKRNSTFTKNVQNATSFVQATLNSLDQVSTALSSIISVANSANNALNAENYTTMAQNIKDSLNTMVQSVNEKYNGMQIFGGTNFSEDPVSLDANGKAVISDGDHSGSINVQVSNKIKETMNVPGNKVTETGIFQAVNDIITSLENNIQPTTAQLTALTNANNKLINVQSLAGEKENRLSNINDVLTTQKTSLEELLNNIQGIDTAKLSVDLTQQDYLLQLTDKLLAQWYSTTSVADYI
jgi:flagellar hook-associated protein 3 FlgL